MLCYTQNNVASELITNKMINGICYNIWTNLTSESDYAYVTSPQMVTILEKLQSPIIYIMVGKISCY